MITVCMKNEVQEYKYNKFRNHSFLILLVNLPGSS